MCVCVMCECACVRACVCNGIIPEVYKHGDVAATRKFMSLFQDILEEGTVNQAYVDATVSSSVHLSKMKGCVLTRYHQRASVNG